MRSIYQALASTIALLAFIFLSLGLKAQTLGALKNKYKYIGIESAEFNSRAVYGKQRSLSWCWAACVQMVLNYHEVSVTQEKIVKKAFGKIIDQPADPLVMFRVLNGWEFDYMGRPVKINSNQFPTSIKEISSFLKTKRPLIVGLKQNGRIGHAYVLIGLFSENGNGNNNSIEHPHSVILIDPWPGNESVRDMSWDEFVDRLLVAYKIWVD